MNLAHNEVNIQYRYGAQFRVRSVVLITWEGVKDPLVPVSFLNISKLLKHKKKQLLILNLSP